MLSPTDLPKKENEGHAKRVKSKTAVSKPAITPISDSTGGTRRLAFRLDAELHEQLTKRVNSDSTTQAYVVLDAIESAYADDVFLDDNHSDPAPAGSLFVRPKGRKPAIPTVPTEIRVDSAAQNQIDKMVQICNFESRTQLITSALRHHLS